MIYPCQSIFLPFFPFHIRTITHKVIYLGFLGIYMTQITQKVINVEQQQYPIIYCNVCNSLLIKRACCICCGLDYCTFHHLQHLINIGAVPRDTDIADFRRQLESIK